MKQGMQDFFKYSLTQIEDPGWGIPGDKAEKLRQYDNRGP